LPLSSRAALTTNTRLAGLVRSVGGTCLPPKLSLGASESPDCLHFVAGAWNWRSARLVTKAAFLSQRVSMGIICWRPLKGRSLPLPLVLSEDSAISGGVPNTPFGSYVLAFENEMKKRPWIRLSWAGAGPSPMATLIVTGSSRGPRRSRRALVEDTPAPSCYWSVEGLGSRMSRGFASPRTYLRCSPWHSRGRWWGMSRLGDSAATSVQNRLVDLSRTRLDELDAGRLLDHSSESSSPVQPSMSSCFLKCAQTASPAPQFPSLYEFRARHQDVVFVVDGFETSEENLPSMARETQLLPHHSKAALLNSQRRAVNFT